jgi:hypothetical protein
MSKVGKPLSPTAETKRIVCDGDQRAAVQDAASSDRATMNPAHRRRDPKPDEPTARYATVR